MSAFGSSTQRIGTIPRSSGSTRDELRQRVLDLECCLPYLTEYGIDRAGDHFHTSEAVLVVFMCAFVLLVPAADMASESMPHMREVHQPWNRPELP